MFDLPQEYQNDVMVKLKDFIPKTLKLPIKKRLAADLKQVKLVGQIAGENIPSVINENDHCQVVQFYDITVNDIKTAPFIATTYQNLIKPLCVLRIHDGLKEAYSMGLKRLSQIEENKIVLTDSLLTPAYPLVLPDTAKAEFLKQLAFPNIRNKNNKVVFYQEMYIRAYIINHQKADDEMVKLLASNIWYDPQKTWKTYELIKTLVENKELQNKLTGNGDKIKMNQTIKTNLEQLKNIINGG
ncbi:MAG: DUF4391 domain-containing protein [Acetobacterium sp.]|nr:DUF4391 domain-containing protein [Acetobacterium sp.]